VTGAIDFTFCDFSRLRMVLLLLLLVLYKKKVSVLHLMALKLFSVCVLDP
jgi:hypothetical protein